MITAPARAEQGMRVEARGWFCGSLADAPDQGAEPARAAIDRSPDSNIEAGMIMATGNRTRYHGYLIAETAVAPCQSEIAACDQLPGQLL